MCGALPDPYAVAHTRAANYSKKWGSSRVNENALLCSIQTSVTYARSNIQCARSLLLKRYPHCVLYCDRYYDAHAFAPPRARKRILLSDDEEYLEEEVHGAVSAFNANADDDGMPLDGPVRASESMGSDGEELEAIATTSRATRSRKRAVLSTPYERVQAVLRQCAPAPAS